MKKTLLLCFIHGFKGGDDTFGAEGEFTEHLAALLSAELPRVAIRTLVYPKYETRGDLRECVARFRDWLVSNIRRSLLPLSVRITPVILPLFFVLGVLA